jgi:hypothetical protein
VVAQVTELAPEPLAVEECAAQDDHALAVDGRLLQEKPAGRIALPFGFAHFRYLADPFHGRTRLDKVSGALALGIGANAAMCSVADGLLDLRHSAGTEDDLVQLVFKTPNLFRIIRRTHPLDEIADAIPYLWIVVQRRSIHGFASVRHQSQCTGEPVVESLGRGLQEASLSKWSGTLTVKAAAAACHGNT